MAENLSFPEEVFKVLKLPEKAGVRPKSQPTRPITDQTGNGSCNFDLINCVIWGSSDIVKTLRTRSANSRQ